MRRSRHGRDGKLTKMGEQESKYSRSGKDRVVKNQCMKHTHTYTHFNGNTTMLGYLCCAS